MNISRIGVYVMRARVCVCVCVCVLVAYSILQSLIYDVEIKTLGVACHWQVVRLAIRLKIWVRSAALRSWWRRVARSSRRKRLQCGMRVCHCPRSRGTLGSSTALAKGACDCVRLSHCSRSPPLAQPQVARQSRARA